MSEYLTKEEVKQWRSSLEKITLEEFAQRLGKSVREERQTHDLVDVVLRTTTSTNRFSGDFAKKEKVVEIAKKSIAMQNKPSLKKKNTKDLRAKLTFKKPLTEREERVLDEFLQKSGEIVYAKELAKVLSLPNDYVYKYIKNLRTKIGQEVLQNSANGGYKLIIK